MSQRLVVRRLNRLAHESYQIKNQTYYEYDFRRISVFLDVFCTSHEKASTQP